MKTFESKVIAPDAPRMVGNEPADRASTTRRISSPIQLPMLRPVPDTIFLSEVINDSSVLSN